MRSDLSIDRPIENPLALATGQFHNERQKAIPVKNLGRGARLALERKGTVPYALEIIAQRAVQFDWNPNTAHALTCVFRWLHAEPVKVELDAFYRFNQLSRHRADHRAELLRRHFSLFDQPKRCFPLGGCDWSDKARGHLRISSMPRSVGRNAPFFSRTT